GGGSHQAPVASAQGLPALLHRDHHPHRPDHDHPRLRGGRAIHLDPHHRPRGHGHVPLPPQPHRHHHPQRGRAHLHRGHLRGDVSPRLQPGQPLPHGPHHLYRLRGGRRHRDDREHRPLHRGG